MSAKTRFGIMMFLQYAIWGAWAPVLSVYLYELGFDGVQVGSLFALLPLATIISPFLGESRVKVKLPQATTSEVKDQEKVEITYSTEGELAVGEKEVTLAQLPQLLKERFQTNPGQMAVIKADEKVRYEKVEKIIAIARESGAERIAIATEQKKRIPK